uniref:RELB proto-onco, NF-kB subunit n=1 Tax=Ornithorhynchus anatinus TaxID=9258 RepID=A0A6I8NSM5_ORNAN
MGRGWGGRRRSLRVPQVGPAHPARAPRLRPRLVITEQPKQRGMRFRYECEGRSAGSILGETAPEASKTLPPSRWGRGRGLREVDVVACLVWKDWPHRVHPHGLVGKDCADGVCRVRLRPHSAAAGLEAESNSPSSRIGEKNRRDSWGRVGPLPHTQTPEPGGRPPLHPNPFSAIAPPAPHPRARISTHSPALSPPTLPLQLAP